MDIQRAIRWVKQHAATDHCEASDDVLAALQEQAERENGCDFCCYTEYPDKTLYPKEGYLFYAGYSKQTAPDDFHEEEVEDINFCPVCGRRLK